MKTISSFSMASIERKHRLDSPRLTIKCDYSVAVLAALSIEYPKLFKKALKAPILRHTCSKEASSLPVLALHILWDKRWAADNKYDSCHRAIHEIPTISCRRAQPMFSACWEAYACWYFQYVNGVVIDTAEEEEKWLESLEAAA
jgi:hypothetical protein